MKARGSIRGEVIGVRILSEISWQEVLLGAGFFVLGVTLSLGLVALVLVRMPADYFMGDAPPSLFAGKARWIQTSAFVGKNVLGVLLVLLGIALSVPGVPGQGLLTILIGITLIEFPGKRKLEQRIMRNPMVFAGANRIRRRFGKDDFRIELKKLP